jgi:hypothetical protein
MKKVFTTLFLTALLYHAYGQMPHKYAIGKSGCFAYFFCNPDNFEYSKSPDSADVYTGECSVGDMSYGLICVRLNTPTTDLQLSEGVLIQYLEYLKGTLNITGARGYSKGHHLKGNLKTTGVADYWQDKDGNNWKVRGWTNGAFIGVLFVYAKTEVPDTRSESFLDGITFPHG